MRIRKAKSVADIQRMNFETLPFEGKWLDSFGEPETTGSWIIWGQSGNGKTRFALQLASYFTKLGYKVFYNTLEEGMRLSFQRAVLANTYEQGLFQFESEDMDALRVRISRKRAAKVIFIDSLQYSYLTIRAYKKLLRDHADKLFIFISHAGGDMPKGGVADAVRYQSDIKIRVEGYKALPKSRYGGGDDYIIWEEGATKYWGPIMENEQS